MPTVTSSLKHELEDMETIQFVTSALFDVSAEKIGGLKAAFEQNQEFYTDISDLYGAVKGSAQRRNELVTASEGARRVLYVPYTSNERFYGSINLETMRAFVHAYKSKPAEVLVVGRTGQTYLRDRPTLVSKADELTFSEDDPSPDEMRSFLNRVAVYDEVRIFYPSFVNVFTQTIENIDITHALVSENAGDVVGEMDYIFEPELPKILQFFETRIRYLLFERAVLETQLSRTASRLFSMNRAQDRAELELKNLRRTVRSQTETSNDMRLLESFTAITRLKK